jgi:hypothetical protein
VDLAEQQPALQGSDEAQRQRGRLCAGREGAAITQAAQASRLARQGMSCAPGVQPHVCRRCHDSASPARPRGRLIPAGPLRPASWTAVRLARPARDLDRSTRFYRDLLGLPLLGGFENHDGYDGVFFALPGRP